MTEYIYDSEILKTIKMPYGRRIDPLKLVQKANQYDYLTDNTKLSLATTFSPSTSIFKIVDLPEKGFCTFLFNTWIVMARTFFLDTSEIVVYGEIKHPQSNSLTEIENRERFWKQFGFELNGLDMKAKLSELTPIPHRKGGMYYAHPYDFTSASGQNLYSDGLMHKFKSSR